MRLRKIKLSGFKTFVDPTTLVIPGNLVGIVGPNGCGKSNIIDAVTWVMGESSAKHLRGESITDVIFNGSTSRQPVSQAMVELIFDNTEGRAGGQYAAYTEISIKRQLNREGVSVYSLNGARCRRKDIHSLFLGTGLGPRGYSIIEQGMISRLIEAKPDELRVFIEEAAGISKYRERRKETENRIRHTRENLHRLNDIREELERQLNHLQRQARAAERYQVLKQEQRKLDAELLALEYRDFRSETRRREEKVRIHENQVEQAVAELRKLEAEIERARDDLATANEKFTQVQSGYYQVGGEISQYEQKIQHANERISALVTDITKLQQSIDAAEEQHSSDQQQLKDLTAKSGHLEPELQGSRSDTNKAYDTLNQAEQAMQKWQDEWDAFREAGANFTHQLEAANSRIAYLQETLEEISYRRQTLEEERESTDADRLADELHQLEARLETATAEIIESRGKLDEQLHDVRHWRESTHNLTERIAVLRTGQQKLEGTLASLLALQQQGVGMDQPEIDGWLAGVEQQSPGRLLEHIKVDPEWAPALDIVLGQQLHAFVVNDFQSVLGALDSLTSGAFGLVDASVNTSVEDQDFPRLLDKIVADASLNNLLRGIYAADDIESALEIYPRLKEHESVVTRSGIWIGKGWIQAKLDQQTEDNALLREQKIRTLKSESEALVSAIKELQQQLERARGELLRAEETQHTAQKSVDDKQQELTALHTEHAGVKARYQQILKRLEQIEEELETLQHREDTDREELENARRKLDRLQADQQSLRKQEQHLAAQREKHQNLLGKARTEWQTTHETSHEIALQLESLSSQKASIEQAIRRSEIQINNLMSNRQDLQRQLEQTSQPLPALQAELESRLAARMETEKKLNLCREQVRLIDSSIREKEQERVAAEQRVEELRGTLEKARMEAQEVSIRLQTLVEQLQAGSHDAEEILKDLDTVADKQIWREKIADCERKIQRLGPINLAAIDEFNQLSERKNYLDRQNTDLVNALDTLENAIRKIDKETRARFKETFDELNLKLKEMFPILFGGGHAYLEMTGEDLLETGVAIMARPPGKKNSSIHLLSGGEKALTAVALVFAIFRLNPAPFCILDEVDAPLDDSNAARFSELLARMAADVQFVFITHNKITMEIAQQLLGVTMSEPGVSRLVSVDVEEAVKMAVSA